MRKIKPTSYTEAFSVADKHAKEGRDGNACAPIAVSIVAGKPFAEVQEMFQREGRKLGKGTPRGYTMAVLKRLGLEIKRVNIEGVIKGFPKPHCDVLKNLTTHHGRRFPGTFDPSKTYLAFTRGHVLAIKDGEVQDWSINNSLRITELYEVVIK